VAVQASQARTRRDLVKDAHVFSVP
jgi:hypothetical protein